MDMRGAVRRAGGGHAGRRLIGSLIIIAIGIVAVTDAASLPLGSLRRLGPGAVPTGLGIVMIGLGIAFFFDVPEFEDRVPGLLWRPVIAICAAMGAFAVLVSVSGMFAAIVGMVGISEFSEREYRWKKALMTALGLCVFITLVKYLLRDSLILDLY